MSVLDDLATTIAQLAASVGPSVVGIGRHTRGSGVVVEDGRVLTNAHNLRSDTVNVTFADGRAVQGRVAAIDGDGDLAVIEVDTAGAPALTSAYEEPSPSVDPCSASRPRAAAGCGSRSASCRRSPRPSVDRVAGASPAASSTAPLAPRSSGSALVDAEGRLIGLNTNRIGEGFYLALPADARCRPGSTRSVGARPRPASGSASSSPRPGRPPAAPLGRAGRPGRRPRPWPG